MPDPTKGIGTEFMRLTRYEHSSPSPQQLGLPQPPLTRRHPEALDGIPLPTPGGLTIPPVSLLHLITNRTSLRSYSDTDISLLELSALLWSTQGVKEIYANRATLRTVPSAGARHALETYLLLNRVSGIEPGLYQYLPIEHEIARIPAAPELPADAAGACLGQNMLTGCAAAFFWCADPRRMTWRYGQRGYRYLHLDAGHICQNLYLAAEAIGCGACAIAAFDDEALAGLLRLDEEEFVIYCATVGKKTGK